jgi:hypothetical protein
MNTRITHTLIAVALGVGLLSGATASQVEITVENLTPSGGLYFTPVWVGIHDGSFDSFDAGSAASMSLQTLAETGNPGPLSGDFAVSGAGVDGVVFAPNGFAGAPVFDPGDSASITLNVDPAADRWLSFASMIIPSNDAFIGNDDPMAYEIFDATGVFTGPLEILVLGTQVWDAGTEANTELGAAFLDLPGMDTAEMGVVGLHPGFDPMGNILGGMTVAGTTVDPLLGDFTQQGYQIAKISINAVPEPGVIALLGAGLGLVRVSGRKRILGSTRA